MSAAARDWAWVQVGQVDLPSTAALMLLRLADRCRHADCYYRDDELAEALRCNRGTVVAARRALVEAGLVTAEFDRVKAHTTYTLLLEIPTAPQLEIPTVAVGNPNSGSAPAVGNPNRRSWKSQPSQLEKPTATPIYTPETPETPEIFGAAVATPAHDEPDPPEKTEPAETPQDDPPAKPERQRSAGELRAIAADGILQALVADLTAAGQVVTRQSHLKPAIGRLIRQHGEDRVRDVFAGVSGVDLGRWPFDGRGIGWLVSGPGFDALANAGRGRHGVTDTGWHRSQDDEDRWWDATPEEQERERAARLADGRRAEEVRHD